MALAAINLRAYGTTELIQAYEVIGRILKERPLNVDEVEFWIECLSEVLEMAVEKWKEMGRPGSTS